MDTWLWSKAAVLDPRSVDGLQKLSGIFVIVYTKFFVCILLQEERILKQLLFKASNRLRTSNGERGSG